MRSKGRDVQSQSLLSVARRTLYMWRTLYVCLKMIRTY